MQPVTAVGAALLMLALAACGSPAASGAASVTSTTSTATPTAPTTGTLTGVVRLYGGPLNPMTQKMALNGAPGPDWAVAVMSGSRTVARTTSDARGRFRFVLPPGRYTLACGQSPAVVVTAGRTASTYCDVPVP